jgi:hypothetical protein
MAAKQKLHPLDVTLISGNPRNAKTFLDPAEPRPCHVESTIPFRLTPLGMAICEDKGAAAFRLFALMLFLIAFIEYAVPHEASETVRPNTLGAVLIVLGLFCIESSFFLHFSFA